MRCQLTDTVETFPDDVALSPVEAVCRNLKSSPKITSIERVRALADISRLGLCCHSNETRAPIANPPNNAQLEGTPYHSPKLHPGPCSSVRMRRNVMNGKLLVPID